MCAKIANSTRGGKKKMERIVYACVALYQGVESGVRTTRGSGERVRARRAERWCTRKGTRRRGGGGGG